MWKLVGLCLTHKKLQHFDPWKPFQTLNILAWSEKWLFCHSSRPSLSSAFSSHLFHSPSLEKAKGLLIKGHCKTGVHLPTAKSIWAIRSQGTRSPSQSTSIVFIFSGKVPSSSTGYSVDVRCLSTWVQDTWRLRARYQVTQACLCCVIGLFPLLPITVKKMRHICSGPSRHGCTALLPNSDNSQIEAYYFSKLERKIERRQYKWNWRYNIMGKGVAKWIPSEVLDSSSTVFV